MDSNFNLRTSNFEPRTIRILFPLLHYPPVIGGIEIWAKEIAEGLAGKAEVFVITGKVSGQSVKEIKNGANILRVGWFSLKNLSHSPLIYTFSLLPFIYYSSAKMIKKQGINSLHCVGFLSGLIGYCLKKRFGIPYMVVAQSLQENKPAQSIKKVVYRNADLCIVASQAIANYFEKSGVQKSKIKIIPNGIDISRFSGINKGQARKNLGLNPDDFVIITVARLDERKGIRYLIEAIGILNQDFPDNKYQLIIIGDGEERKKLENLTKELSVKDKVRFLGAVPNSELPQYLSAGDCFCLPSIEEGFGLAVLEAMAVGLPVVATRVGGILDLVENGRTGILVESKNPEAIAKVIQSVMGDKNLGQKLAGNAKFELVRYSWLSIVNQIFDLHKKCDVNLRI